ncbi:hypothetical protein KEM56_005228 [Ascosphaera pollenicola]|nr:hypothetical protein KEM56_005228 [Ascosphaera pollenicola]
MASYTRVASLIDELIFATTGVENKKILRESVLGRVNQYEVYQRIEGFQEKSEVLCNDELASALGKRMQQLDGKQESWIPDILFLLLELSDEPETKTDLAEVEASFQPVKQEEEALTWKTLYSADPPQGEEKSVWQHPNYAENSSEDELMDSSEDGAVQSDTSASQEASDEFPIVPGNMLKTVANDALIDKIRNSQKFQTSAALPPDGEVKENGRYLDETKAVREAIFMLRGLSSDLFVYRPHGVEVKAKFRLTHASKTTFTSLLKSLAGIGAKINILRTFTRSNQQAPFIQTFQNEIEQQLSKFDMFLSSVETRYATHDTGAVVSILELLYLTQQKGRLLLDLAQLVVSLTDIPDGSDFLCLDLLYDLVCAKQVSGQGQDLKELMDIFFRCFEAYSKPIRLWMTSGDLDTSQGRFFVSEVEDSNDLRHLWNRWFNIDAEQGQLYAPKFLQGLAKKIFTCGKSVVFLRKLKAPIEATRLHSSSPLSIGELRQHGFEDGLVPFSTLLEATFGQIIERNHAFVSSSLRRHLGESCGLWNTLEAIEHVYLAKDLSLTAILDKKVFDGIHNRLQYWNNRSLLTELAHRTFKGSWCVEVERLVVRAKELSHQSFNKYCLSVQIMRAVAYDYVVPWPIANIIPKESLLMYRRLSTFLMQIRYAKHGLERQRVKETIEFFSDDEDKELDTMGYAIRYKFIWFLNIFYSHIISVIASETRTMRKSLENAADVDEMITVHHRYITSMMAQCFLSAETDPVRQQLLQLLDSSIQMANIQNIRHDNDVYDTGQTNVSGGRQADLWGASSARSDECGHDYTFEGDTEDADKSQHDDESVHSTYQLDSVTYRKNIVYMKALFEKLCGAVITEIRCLDDLHVHPSWSLLAEKMECKSSYGF